MSHCDSFAALCICCDNLQFILTLSDCLQVLANLVMEELLPSLQTELLPKLKGKKAERKRVWFVVSDIIMLHTSILRLQMLNFDITCCATFYFWFMNLTD